MLNCSFKICCPNLRANRDRCFSYSSVDRQRWASPFLWTNYLSSLLSHFLFVSPAWFYPLPSFSLFNAQWCVYCSVFFLCSPHSCLTCESQRYIYFLYPKCIAPTWQMLLNKILYDFYLYFSQPTTRFLFVDRTSGAIHHKCNKGRRWQIVVYCSLAWCLTWRPLGFTCWSLFLLRSQSSWDDLCWMMRKNVSCGLRDLAGF